MDDVEKKVVIGYYTKKLWIILWVMWKKCGYRCAKNFLTNVYE